MEINIQQNGLRVIKMKKLVSLNPDRYEYKSLNFLIDEYRFYIIQCEKTPYPTVPKYFETWLETEI